MCIPISVILCCACVIGGTGALIVPDEIPTLLSLIYSNIPTLKKGTDSRVGWGFRLGDRADFQVLVELGPQKETQPLANQGGSNNNKRNVADGLVNKLYAQRLKEKNQISDTEGGKFLDQWSKDISNPTAAATVEQITDPRGPTRIPLGVGEVDARDVIPEDAVLRLMELYGDTQRPKTTLKPKSTTSYKDALDNVDLD